MRWLRRRVAGLTLELQQLHAALLMRLIQEYRAIIDRLLPSRSLRRRLYTKLVRAAVVLLFQGPWATVRRAAQNVARAGSSLSAWAGSALRSATRLSGKNGRLNADALGASSRLRDHDGRSVLSDYVPLRASELPAGERLVKPIAFYLPQFHPIPENDEWWGRGFTDWVNVSKAVPQFSGHYQPHLPGELGFYDLRLPEIQRRQVELAKNYGIYGFCFYYYWFAGKRMLERPIDQYLADPSLDLPFCLCWANENWTRRWDGAENEVLIRQVHGEHEYRHFIRDIARYFEDPRYIRVAGRPLLLVYRVDILPNPVGAAQTWREECRRLGLGEIYVAAVQSFGISDPRPYGFDAAIEFPPHHLEEAIVHDRVPAASKRRFAGQIFDYTTAAKAMIAHRAEDYTLYKTVMPSWDNTPRKGHKAHVFINSSPRTYKQWLEEAVRYSIRALPKDRRFVFINAWNEWAEGTHLEPDQRYGYAYLQATAEAVAPQPSNSKWTILFVSQDAAKAGAQTVLLNTIAWLAAHTSIALRLLCLGGGDLLPEFQKLVPTAVVSELHGGSPDDEASMRRTALDLCGGVPDLIYGNSVASGRAYRGLRDLGAPMVTHFHELETSINYYARGYIGTVLEESSHFIACSEAVKDNLVRNHGISPGRISTAYSSITVSGQGGPVSDSAKLAARRRLRLDQNARLIFGCGIGMPFRKGADLFIELGRALRDRGVENWHLYWIGGFDPAIYSSEHGTWAAHLARLKRDDLGSLVTFLGFTQDPLEYLQTGDVFVLPSREDPFPLVALEAASVGLPIICFDRAGGMPEFVRNDAGCIVPFGDVRAMAAEIASLLKDEPFEKVAGRRGNHEAARFLRGRASDAAGSGGLPRRGSNEADVYCHRAQLQSRQVPPAPPGKHLQSDVSGF